MSYEDWCGQKIDSLEYEVEQLTKALEKYRKEESEWRGDIFSRKDLEGQVVQMACEALDLIYEDNVGIDIAVASVILDNPSIMDSYSNQLEILGMSVFADYGRENNLINFDAPIKDIIEQCAVWAVDAEVTAWINMYLDGVEQRLYDEASE
jgi:hypothetical protein